MPLPPVPDLPDNSALQRFQSFPPDFISPIRRFPANEQAQSLVFDAWEEPDPLRKFRLCQGALAIFPFSVDSFNCIADIYRRYWEDSTSALVAYERALACARLLWSGLENQQEILWGHIEHRPFLRSYHGLAVVNLDLGNSEAAIEQLQFLLRVNPTDNQGCRKLLFSALLDEDRLQEASEVAKKHSDGRDSTDAWFLWGIVLLDYIQFHRGAYSAKVPEESLCLALQSNNFVPELLLSDTPLIQDPDTVSPGSLDEATSYVISSLTSWRRAEGALTWLEELRERGGPKPPDDGAILFNLLTKGRILVKVNNASGADTKIEVTSSLEHMYGQALPEFKLPSGMKDHDPSKIVCFDLDWDASTKFPSFSYDAVEKVYYWEVLNFRKIWKKPKEGRLCSKCYEKATQKCSRCHFAWYCSRQCQVSHWNEGHKRQCKKYVKR